MAWHAGAEYIDSLVREYLVFRKMNAVVKAFDAELKNDKDKGFRVDKIVQQVLQYIHSYDIDGLTSYWKYLKESFLIRFAKYHLDAIARFEADLYRLYMVHAVQNNKMKELQVCLQRLTELDSVPDLKDWYVLLFYNLSDLKTRSTLSSYFSKQWGETFIVSLFNILSAVFSCMPLPRLIQYCMDDGKRIETLEKENEMLRHSSISSEKVEFSIGSSRTPSYIERLGKPGSGSQTKPISKEGAKKSSFLNLLKDTVSKSDISQSDPNKGISLPKSSSFTTKTEHDKKQIGEKPAIQDHTDVKSFRSDSNSSASEGMKFPNSNSNNTLYEPVTSTPTIQPREDFKLPDSIEISYDNSINLHKKNASPISPEPTLTTTTAQVDKQTGFVLPKVETLPYLKGTKSTENEPYLILSKDIFHEHLSAVLQCKFDNTGKTIASVDNGGIVKVWQNDPTIKSLNTVVFHHSKIQCLEWCSKSTDFLIFGTSSGTIRFFNIMNNATVKEVIVDDAYCSLQRMRACPSGTSLVTSSLKPGESMHNCAVGRIMRWDVRPSEISFSRKLHTNNSFFGTCMDYNHNGNLMVVGDSSGTVSLFDMKALTVIRSCQAHTGAVSSVQFSSDEALVLSIGADNEMKAWDVNYLETEAVKMKFPSSSSNLPLLQDSNMPLMALSPDGHHALVSGGCRGLVYNLDGANKTAMKVLALPEHKSNVTALDWISSKSCGRCLTGSADGKVHVTTLLSQS